MGHLKSAPIALAAMLFAQSCYWSAPPDDAGDEAWVRMAVPALLGRKPRNSDEVRVLADYVGVHGRAVVARMLMDQPEFDTYWAQVLAEDLKPDRAYGGTQNADCWERPMLDSHRWDDLATLLAHGDPTSRLCYTVSAEGEEPEVALLTGEWGDIHEQQLDGRGGTPHIEEGPDYADPEDDAPVIRSSGEPTFDVETIAPRWAGPAEAAGSYTYADLEGFDQQNDASPPVVEDTAGARRAGEPDPAPVSVCYPFNMADALMAAVTEDDLFGPYRANLGPLSTFHGGFSEEQYRRFMSDKMLDTYFNRQTSCMTCHTTNWSATDARPRNGMWDRFEHTAYDLEGGAFSYTDGGTFKYGGNGGPDLDERLRNYFRTDQHPTSGGYNAFGLDDSCVTRTSGGYTYDGWSWGGVGPDTHMFSRAGIAQQPLGIAEADLAENLRVGMLGLDVIEVEDPPWADMGSLAFEQFSTCTGCHPSTFTLGDPPNPYGAPDLSQVVPEMSNERLYEIIRYGSGNMYAVGESWSDAQIRGTITYMRQTKGWYDPTPMVADGNEALALFLAYNIVDNIVEEAMGGRFTIHHGHYRNGDQQFPHAWLMGGFLADGWSLQRVLLDVVTSEAFARKAPQDSTLEYDLQMLAYPWAEEPPYEPSPQPDGNANSVGDHVYRYSVQSLFHSYSWAMYWPLPRTYGGNQFPKSSSMLDSGRRASFEMPAVDDPTLSTLLGWEKALTRSYGSLDACEKPPVYDVDVPYPLSPATGAVINGTQYEDWIDIASLQADGTHTVEEVVIALKDRMITDPTLDAAEIPLIETLVGANLTDTWDDAAMEGGLRQFCGVLAKTPQFMLGGLAHGEPLPASSPSFVPCVDGLCTYSELDAYYDDFLCDAGAGWEYCPIEADPNPPSDM